MKAFIATAVPMLTASHVAAQVPNACQVPRESVPLIADGDAFIGPQVCNNQDRIRETWGHFHMGEGGWDGYGLMDDACTSNTALSRTLKGLLLMRDAGANPTCEPTGFPLDWAYCFSSEIIVKLVAGCYSAIASAMTYTWGLDQWNERTELYFDFYYNFGPPVRASTIFHEARHADDDCEHTTNCPAGLDDSGNYTNEACDPQYEHGCVTGTGKGAYAWSAIWLHRYAVDAVPHLINADLRAYAVDNANVYLGNNFEVAPCFRFDRNTGHVDEAACP
jgi:hypothetical protein